MSFLTNLLQPKPLFALVLALYALFGSLHLTQFLTADEHYWLYERVPKYWNAWGDWELRKTFINDKPGVSLALITGPALLALPDTATHCVEQDNRLYQCQVDETAPLLLAFRLPLLLANGLILIYLFFLLTRLFDPWIALFASAFTALSPVLLGMTQIVNPDALLWSTSTAAFLSYFALLRFDTRRDLFATLLFTTLALLSKYTALILFPAFGLAYLIHFIAASEEETLDSLRTQLSTGFYRLVMIAAASVVLVLAAVPAFFLDRKYLAEYLATVPDKEVLLFFFAPVVLLFLIDLFLLKSRCLLNLRYLLRKAAPSVKLVPIFFFFLFTAVIISRYAFPGWNIYAIPFDIKDLTDARYHASVPNFLEAFFLEWNAIVFSLPPVLLLSLFGLGIIALRRRAITDGSIILTLSLFMLGFTFILIHSNILATARYAIILFPLLAVLGAFGLREFALWGERKWSYFRNIVAISVIITSTASLCAIYPFYANYANTLLPKNALITDAWGYGGYEAAQYLNTLPNASALTVWSDYYGVCEFFVGHCLTAYTFDGNEIKPDYYVLTRRGEARYMSRFTRWERLSGLTAYQYYAEPHPDWQLFIDGRPGNFIKVVRVETGLHAAIITDIDHCPSREAVSQERIQSFIAQNQEQKTDFVISLGDNASHRLRNCSETGDMDARYIADLLRSIGPPAHFVLGDHDITSTTSSYQAWLETTEREPTYYSFDAKDVHIIILDTVLGGEVMRAACSEDTLCVALEHRLEDIINLSFLRYTEQYPDAQRSQPAEQASVKKLLEQTRAEIDLTRSFGNRDRGRVAETQLAWLQRDIRETPLDRIIVFSDHPLFPFQSDRKSYDIINGDAVRKILESSGKKVVALSGETHLWHEESINGIRYYIVDEFRKANGSWARITWDETDFRLERITH
ncbi:MAG: glycosyltransferase family 39 protein [Candidatus Moraniibacteriota bacterium]